MRGESRRVFEIVVGACLVMLGLVVRFGESACVDTMLEARDSNGNYCFEGNYDSGNICGLYDDFDFTANQMCCDCGGGFKWEYGSLDEEWDASAPYCYDDTGNGQLNLYEYTCGAYNAADGSFCTAHDDSDFTASEMCCACGGGDTRICENTDNGAKNSHGDSCVDVAIWHNHGYPLCNSDFDTSTFTASTMCCACGGGRTILPSTTSETCEHTSGNHLDTEGDTCTHYRKYHLGQGCDGTYDDDDFTASEMCCGCTS